MRLNINKMNSVIDKDNFVVQTFAFAESAKSVLDRILIIRCTK